MTPWILQALYECQGSAVLTHRSLRTQLRNQWEEAGVDLQEGEETGRKQAGIHFSCCPSTSSVWWSSGHTALSQNVCAAARKLCCFWGQSLMCGLVGFFFFSFFHLDPFTFQHPEAESTFSARNCHLGKSLYWRSSQLTLTLVSEIVLLLLPVTPKIAT